MAKLSEKQFVDWEHFVFGYGYAKGEDYFISALKHFFLNEDTDIRGNRLGTFTGATVEAVLGKIAFYFLIAFLHKNGIIELYNTPRIVRLTGKGEILKEFVLSYKDRDLSNMIYPDADKSYCSPGNCTCQNLHDSLQCASNPNPLF